MLLDQILVYTTNRKIIKRFAKTLKFKISAPTQNDKFELPYSSCSVSDVLNSFDYIIRNLETPTDNLPITIFISKNNRKQNHI